MSDPRNLSFSTGFNQQKILLNSSVVVTVPTSAGTTADTLLTVPTGLLVVPTFRAFFEHLGVLYPITRQFELTDTDKVGDGMTAGIDASFNFIIKSYNQDPPVTNVTLYYRVYKDSKPL